MYSTSEKEITNYPHNHKTYSLIMLILISPAKIQNANSETISNLHSVPKFMTQANQLVKLIRKLSPKELAELLAINTDLTYLNFDRYFNWHLPFTPENSKQAIFTFNGEVFKGFDASSLSNSDLEYAQNHLRILSGLYGILRPLDLMQPYRLEVSSKLDNPMGKDLYTFWRDKVTKSVLKVLKSSGKPEYIINLASAEYMKVLDLKNSNLKIIDVEFHELKDDKYRQVVIYTKKARGLMARYIIKNRIEDIEEIKGFNLENYWFNPQKSTESKLVFTRGV